MKFRLRSMAVVASSSCLALSILPLFAACSSSSEQPATCDIEAQTGCANGLVCETVVGGDAGTPADGGAAVGCFAPVQIQGIVTADSETGTPVGGALVVARDANGAASGDVASTGADGSFSLRVPAPRDSSGKPIDGKYTLRVDAAKFDSFPGTLRTALPIDVTTAAAPDYIVKTAATNVVLFTSTKTTATGSISGTVLGKNPGGTLVVTEGSTAIADRGGAFTIFNVEPGDRTVQGYAANLQLTPATTTVSATAPTTGVVLAASTAPLSTVSGSVNIVNAPGGSITSVVLAVESTFLESLERGEVPRGLRAGNVTGAFTIDGVPNGKYVVLAAFENDGLVRDPDPGIAGTQIVHIDVTGSPVAAGNFKVTGALEVVSPGRDAPEAVTATPTFLWKDDSSETGYQVRVYDTQGKTVWEKLDVPSVKGNQNVEVPYAGPALAAGHYYQFRATSMKDANPISKTEELRGVFVVQ